MSALSDKVNELSTHILAKENIEQSILEIRERIERSYAEIRDLIDGKVPTEGVPDGGIAVVEVPETPAEPVAAPAAEPVAEEPAA